MHRECISQAIQLTPLSEVLFPLGGGGRRRDGAFREPVEGGVGVYVTWLKMVLYWSTYDIVTAPYKLKDIFRSLPGA